MCVNLAPDAFELRVEGYAGVKPGAEQSSLEALKKAARACPTQCIVIFRDGAEMDLY
jgi:ferredoxin